MKIRKIVLCLCLANFTAQATEEEPPKIQPYEIPTFTGESSKTVHTELEPLVPEKAINADGLFQMIINCYPADSKFNLELAAVGRVTSAETFSVEDDNAGLAKSYAGIVMKMPIYSSSENYRMRETEYKRRDDTANRVGQFVSAITDRNNALRELGLYRSLENRSRIRISEGIVSASEQIGYLEKVIEAEKKLVTSRADIMKSRLSLAGQCRVETYDHVNDYLTEVSK